MSSVSNGASGVSNDRASPAATTKRNTRGKEDLVAGAAAGAIARFIVSPLDMLKIRYQLQTTSGGERKYRSLRSAAKVILYEEGITAFWKGNMLATAMIVPYSATAFAVNQKVKATFLDSNRTPHPGFSLLSGGFAGAAGVAVTYPLDLLRTRFVAQHGKNGYESILKAVTTIARERGVAGFYDGLRPALVGIVPYMGVQFAIYDAAKRSLTAWHESIVNQFARDQLAQRSASVRAYMAEHAAARAEPARQRIASEAARLKDATAAAAAAAGAGATQAAAVARGAAASTRDAAVSVREAGYAAAVDARDRIAANPTAAAAAAAASSAATSAIAYARERAAAARSSSPGRLDRILAASRSAGNAGLDENGDDGDADPDRGLTLDGSTGAEADALTEQLIAADAAERARTGADTHQSAHRLRHRAQLAVAGVRLETRRVLTGDSGEAGDEDLELASMDDDADLFPRAPVAMEKPGAAVERATRVYSDGYTHDDAAVAAPADAAAAVSEAGAAAATAMSAVGSALAPVDVAILRADAEAAVDATRSRDRAGRGFFARKYDGLLETWRASSGYVAGFAGLVAGAGGKFVTFPFDVIKKRYQVESFSHANAHLVNHPAAGGAAAAGAAGPRFTSMASCARMIVNAEGVRGLFKGIAPAVLKAGPNAAITFSVYEAFIYFMAGKDLAKPATAGVPRH